MSLRLLKDPSTVSSRIFVGHLQTEELNKLDLEQHFQKYGTVVGSSINRGFGFIQFEDEQSAINAIQKENGALFKGRRMDVKPAKKDTTQSGGGDNAGNFGGKPGGPNNSFGPGNNPFSGGGDSFGGGNQMFGGGNKPFGNRGGLNNSFGGGNQIRPGGPNRGPGGDQFGGPNQNRPGGGPGNDQFGGPNQNRPGGPGNDQFGGPNQNRPVGNQKTGDIPNQFNEANEGDEEQFSSVGNQNQGPGNQNRGSGGDQFHGGGPGNRGSGNNDQFQGGNQNRGGVNTDQFSGGNPNRGGGNQGGPVGGQGSGRGRLNRGGKNKNKNRDSGGGNNFRDRSPLNRGGHMEEKMGGNWERKSGIQNRGGPGAGYGRDSFGDIGSRGYGRDSFSDVGSRSFDDLKGPLGSSRDANSSFGSISGSGDYPSGGSQEKNDCEIIVVSKALTEYAEIIEMRLKKLGLTVDLLFPNEEVPLSRVLGNIASRGCLYAVVITHVNMEHRSITLNILHGLPQEHRNMPVEDAISLINRDFTNYRAGSSRSVPINAATSVDRHPDAVQVLLNMLADNRRLTVLQYDRVLKYLEVKREEQVQIELGDAQDLAATTTVASDPKQAELQSRILNILNSSKPPAAAVPVPSPVPAPVPVPVPVPATTWATASPSTSCAPATSTTAVTPSPLLNDPTVQKALDSLLQGNLLKSIGEPQTAAPTPLFAAFPNIGRF